MSKFMINLLTSGLALVAAILAIIVWGETVNWDGSNVTAYTLFPLLGLIAFGIMWAQYMGGAFRRATHSEANVLDRFSFISGGIVTTTLVLHPLMLTFKLWQDGAGLPLGSYFNYVGPAMQWTIILGLISLIAFLAFELRHRFQDRPWWRFIDYANDAAIVVIYLHAYNLGSHTQLGWFRAIWLFYGMSLSAALIYKYWLIVQAYLHKLDAKTKVISAK